MQNTKMYLQFNSDISVYKEYITYYAQICNIGNICLWY